MRTTPLLRLTLLAATAISAVPHTASAALGGTIESIAGDRVQMKASSRVMAAAPGAITTIPYTVHELLTPAGITVHEYARIDGRVFAVTWSGPTMPDLRQLLGPHFSSYVVATDNQRHGHAHRSIRADDLVVRSAGHMRAFSGVAYLRSLIPDGVSIDDLS